jgi:hypothetical protein
MQAKRPERQAHINYCAAQAACCTIKRANARSNMTPTTASWSVACRMLCKNPKPCTSTHVLSTCLTQNSRPGGAAIVLAHCHRWVWIVERSWACTTEAPNLQCCCCCCNASHHDTHTTAEPKGSSCIWGCSCFHGSTRSTASMDLLNV